MLILSAQNIFMLFDSNYFTLSLQFQVFALCSVVWRVRTWITYAHFVIDILTCYISWSPSNMRILAAVL